MYITRFDPLVLAKGLELWPLSAHYWVNTTDSEGWTALMHAATKGHSEIVEALLAGGGDVNAKTDDGWTALRMALGEGHSSTVRLLREGEVNEKSTHNCHLAPKSSSTGLKNSNASSPPTTKMTGKTLSHYKVIEKIGQGDVGEVYRAEDTNLSRDVAIKVLPEQFTQDPQRLARFEREAKLLASLNHPNIAAIYGLEEADGVRFLSLELFESETLAEQLTKGPLPVEEALAVCRQIAEGVEAAHEKSVIHRDNTIAGEGQTSPITVIVNCTAELSEGDRN